MSFSNLSRDILGYVLSFYHPFLFMCVDRRTYRLLRRKRYTNFREVYTQAQIRFAIRYKVPLQELYNNLALQGNLPMIQYLWSFRKKPNHYIYRFAAQSGNLQLIKWLWSQRVYQMLDDAYIFQGAVESGNVELLEWLYQRGAAYFYFHLRSDIKQKHLHLLKWLYQHRYLRDVEIRGIAYHYYLHLDWTDILQPEPELLEDSSIIDSISITFLSTCEAIEHNADTLEKLLMQVNANVRCTGMYKSVEKGSLETSKWLHAHGVPFPLDTFRAAFLREDIERLEWLISVGCYPFMSFAFYNRACLRLRQWFKQYLLRGPRAALSHQQTLQDGARDFTN